MHNSLRLSSWPMQFSALGTFLARDWLANVVIRRQFEGRDTPDAKPYFAYNRDVIFVISEANKFVPHEKLDKITMTG